MPSPPWYVISDAHIGVASAERERALVAFLEALEGRAHGLLIVGDLFDFWFEWRRVLPRHGVQVIGALARLVRRGTSVTWLAGNHDCWGGEILTHDLGIRYVRDEWIDDVGAWRIAAHHGDGLRGDVDRGYRRLRAVLRHPLAIRAYRWLHPDLATRLALGTSAASRLRQASDGGAGLRAVAAARLGTPDAPDVVLYGHSHVPALERIGRGIYANCGAWWADPLYLRVDAETLTLARWNGALDTDAVTALPRRVAPAGTLPA
ncbi:MAG: UDP-2,3-diacylglucosamine diphosphatase [Gemmatimonadaceae bacterium]|nr:UDP-2,3-diacylglucosamine diphosphatase [Gemmatimonadaceae bacterium]